MTKKLLMGNEAMAHAALESGVRIVAGYPGTPSSEIVETIARLRMEGAAQGVHVEWSTNEKAALELLFGASLAGARGLFTCKQMGLNVASDALMSLNYVSVRGGLVLIVADDPGPISSQTEQDTRRYAAFAKVPVLDPATPEQAFAMVQAAFELSERFHTPVIVRPTTRIDHASAFFDVSDETHAHDLPEDGFEHDPAKWVIFPRRAYEGHGEINERIAQISRVFATDEEFSAFNEIEEADGAAFGIVAGGVSAAYTREALETVRQRAQAAGFTMPACRFMQVGTPYPFPEEAMVTFARGLADVLVIEELDHVLEDELAKWAGRTHAPLNVHGKLTGEARDRGENDVDDIAARIERFVGLSGRLRLHRTSETTGYTASELPAESLPVRPPVLCPGCPHRGAFYAVKQALGKTPAVLCGDIGCYTLGNAKPLEAVDTCLCMGAGITMAQGLAVTDPGKKAIAFVGDSTFFASGMTGLANAAYNGHDITVMVLDNATTAMTGSQPHPGTGVTLMGQRNAPLSIEKALAATGFTRIYRANPLDKDSSIVAVKAALAHEGPSAVLFKSPCVQLMKPGEPVIINTERCTGCKKCIAEIGCPAIGFNPSATGMRSGDRGQACIDATMCNGCGLCTQVCPFKAIASPVGGEDGDRSSARVDSQRKPKHAGAFANAAKGSTLAVGAADEKPIVDGPADEPTPAADNEIDSQTAGEQPPADKKPQPEEELGTQAEAEDQTAAEDAMSDSRANDEPSDEEARAEQSTSEGDSELPVSDEDDFPLPADETVALPRIEDSAALPADITVAIQPISSGAEPPADEDATTARESSDGSPENDGEQSAENALSADETVALPRIPTSEAKGDGDMPESDGDRSEADEDVLPADETVALPRIEEAATVQSDDDIDPPPTGDDDQAETSDASEPESDDAFPADETVALPRIAAVEEREWAWGKNQRWNWADGSDDNPNPEPEDSAPEAPATEGGSNA